MKRSHAIHLAPPDKQLPTLKIPSIPKRTLGWAIVGLGELALNEVMPAFKSCKLARPVALVSGHVAKARKIAAAYSIKQTSIYTYETFDQLAHNPDIDVVYIILPNSLHAEFTLRALKAGKHVLCEKPMATSIAECEAMIAAAKSARRKLMIAYRLRYEPFNSAAITLCRQKSVGSIKTISANNCQNTPAPNIRLSNALGGGPIQDVGIYCINAFRYLTAEEPIEVSAMAQQPQNVARFREVPESVVFHLRFPSGIIATGTCSFGTAESRNFRVVGSHGVLEMTSAFAYRGQRLFLRADDRYSELKLDPVNQFAVEMEHYSGCILAGRAPKTPGEEGLADIRVITAIQKSLKTGKTITLKS